MTPYDMAGSIRQGEQKPPGPSAMLPATSMTRTLNPRFVSYMTPYDVATNMRQALPTQLQVGHVRPLDRHHAVRVGERHIAEQAEGQGLTL